MGESQLFSLRTTDKAQLKVLLLLPPFKDLRFGAEWCASESLAPPLGLMYLATPLIEQGYQVRFMDLNIERVGEKEFSDILSDLDFLLISVFSHSLENAKAIIHLARKVKKDLFIMCGGPYCNLTQNFIEGADMIVVGEAEGAIEEIMDRIIFRKPLEGLSGLVYKRNGKTVRTPGILQVEDLDRSRSSLSLLAADKDYGRFFGYKLKGVAGIMSSRGCTFRCTYCTHKGIIAYRERTVENVIGELKELKAKGYRYIVFYDDNFFLNKKRALEIMDRVIEEKLDLKFIFQGRIDSPDYPFYEKLRRAGVVMIMFGIENANQDVLDFYQKGITVERVERVLEMCKKAGIIVGGYFMIGSPLEGEEHFRRNKEFLDRAPIDYVHINILGYPQGSKIWEDAVKAGWIQEHEVNVRANATLSRYSLDQWRAKKTALIKGFYSRPGRILRLVHKSLRLGVLPELLKILWHSKMEFLMKVRSPYFLTEKEKIDV